jgi:hypothetical protein
MRHTTIGLTISAYTDPRLLDAYAAVDALPESLLDGFESNRQTARVTAGDTIYDRVFVAPTLAPTRGNGGQLRSLPGNSTGSHPDRNDPATVAASHLRVKRNKPLSKTENGLHRVETKGIEPSTPALQRQCSTN